MEVVSLYALNNVGIAFSLMKGGLEHDVQVNKEYDLIKRIKAIFGSKTAENLVPFVIDNSRPEFTVNALVGDINSCMKKFVFVFFINNRLVDCHPLKKSLETTYKGMLPKGTGAFVFVSLKVPPSILDVNIHPTKSEVRFLYEEEILGNITEKVTSILSADVTSSQINQGSHKSSQNVSLLNNLNTSLNSSSAGVSPRTSLNTTPKYQVRGDTSAQKLDDIFRRQEVVAQGRATEGETSFRKIILTSVLKLKSDVKSNTDNQLKDILQRSAYVGVSKSSKPVMFIQCETSLYSVNLEIVSKELFYQLYLKFFGNFSSFQLIPPLPLTQLLQVHMNKNVDEVNRFSEETIKRACHVIIKRKELLLDYFSIEVTDDGVLTTLPVLLEGYFPDEARLPYFISDLAFEVDWNNELQCFYNIGQAISDLYAVTDRVGDEVISSVVYPLIKQKFHPSSSLQDYIIKVIEQETLYHVFHRC
jgi:DNA mismatch repair protein MLH1